MITSTGQYEYYSEFIKPGYNIEIVPRRLTASTGYNIEIVPSFWYHIHKFYHSGGRGISMECCNCEPYYKFSQRWSDHDDATNLKFLLKLRLVTVS